MLRRELVLGSAAAGAASALPGFASAQALALAKVNIIMTNGTTNQVLSVLLDQLGYLQAYGIDPNFISVADGSKVVAALITGAADICPAAGVTQVLAAIEKGAPLRFVAGASNKNFNAVFSANPAVKTLKDLEGKSVGVGALGTQLHQIMIALFRKYGGDPSKVRFVNVGASVNVLKAVAARVVDAGVAEYWTGLPEMHVLEHGKTFESLTEFVNQASFAPQRAIAQKRALLVKTLAAYAKLYRFIVTGNSEAAFMTAAAKALGTSEAAVSLAKAQYKFYREVQPFAPTLELAPARMAYMQDLNIATGTQKKVLSYDKVDDASLARDALKMLG